MQKRFNSEVSYDFASTDLFDSPIIRDLAHYTKGGRPEQLSKKHTSLQPNRYDSCNLYVLVMVTLVCGQTHAQYFQQVERFKDAWLVSDKSFLFV